MHLADVATHTGGPSSAQRIIPATVVAIRLAPGAGGIGGSLRLGEGVECGRRVHSSIAHRSFPGCHPEDWSPELALDFAFEHDAALDVG
jgi:hypothetical protein